MDMIFIDVCSDYDLVPGKESYGKFLPEPVGHFRGDLPDLKRLDDVICLNAVLFTIDGSSGKCTKAERVDIQ